MRLITSSKGQALVGLLLLVLTGLLTSTVQAEQSLPVVTVAVIGYMLTTAAEDIATKGSQGNALYATLSKLLKPTMGEMLARLNIPTASVQGTLTPEMLALIQQLNKATAAGTGMIPPSGNGPTISAHEGG